MSPAEKCAGLLQEVRRSRPLVHNITNWVVTNVTANATLAIGASPVMAHAYEEAADMAACAGALVLNIGTLTPVLVDSMIAAARRANQLGIPVVFDPVGAGATPLRTGSARRILGDARVDILRGNAGEMGVLGGLGGEVRGVDSGKAARDPQVLVTEVARGFKCVAAVTGKIDHVGNGETVLAIENGHEMFTHVTGTGCMATSLIGAFAAVTSDYLWATAAALACYGIAGEIAATKCAGPGSFQVELIDCLYNLTPGEVIERARLRFVG